MDQKTREKIEKYHGWDHCQHEKIRRYCPECCWDVPAYMRRGEDAQMDKKYFKAKALTASLACGIKR